MPKYGRAMSRKKSRKATKKKPARRTRRAPRKAPAAPKSLVLGRCAQEFAELAANPFARTTTACLPVRPNVDSERLAVSARGQITINVNGEGYIKVNPYIGCVSDNLSLMRTGDAYIIYSDNGTPAVAATPVDFTENGATNPQNAANGGAGCDHFIHQGDSKYVSTQIGEAFADNKVMHRHMVTGIRIKYAGRSDDMSGLIQGFVSPTNDRIWGYNSDQLFRKGCERRAVRDTPELSLVKVPNDSGEFAYSGQADFVVEGGDEGWANMGFLITGATQGAVFEWEVVSHYEFVGELAEPQSRPTMSDSIAPELVCNIANQCGSSLTDGERAVAVLTGVKQTLSAIPKPGNIARQSQRIIQAANPTSATTLARALLIYDKTPYSTAPGVGFSSFRSY